jgi:hypothetical protein
VRVTNEWHADFAIGPTGKTIGKTSTAREPPSQLVAGTESSRITSVFAVPREQSTALILMK